MTAAKPNEIKMLEKAAAEFAKKELAPDREDNDKYPFGPFFEKILEKAFSIDFFHVLMPAEMEGMGLGMQAFCAVMDHICREDASLAGIIFTNTAAQQMMIESGARESLAGIVSGAAKAADALTAFPVFNNPSEIAPTLKAEKTETGYRLFGGMEYLVLGGLARHALLPATLKGSSGYSLFLCRMDDPALKLSEPILSLGLHACPAVDAHADGVAAELIGEAGKAGACFDRVAARMGAAAAAMSAGIMAGSFREAFAFAKGRFQGGREIIKWSEIQMILADMGIKAKVAEMMVDQAARAVDANLPHWEDSVRAAVVHAQQLACEQTCDGIQVLGGVGYMKDYGQEKRFRDAQQAQSLLGLAPMRKLNYIRRKIERA